MAAVQWKLEPDIDVAIMGAVSSSGGPGFQLSGHHVLGYSGLKTSSNSACSPASLQSQRSSPGGFSSPSMGGPGSNTSGGSGRLNVQPTIGPTSTGIVIGSPASGATHSLPPGISGVVSADFINCNLGQSVSTGQASALLGLDEAQFSDSVVTTSNSIPAPNSASTASVICTTSANVSTGSPGNSGASRAAAAAAMAAAFGFSFSPAGSHHSGLGIPSTTTSATCSTVASGSTSPPCVGKLAADTILGPGECLLSPDDLSAAAVAAAASAATGGASEGRPFRCPQCQRGFAVKAGLVQHLRTHTDERPYPCSQCGRAFKQKIQLTTHLRVHSGERPYGCRLCGKLFRQQSHVVQHLRTHTGEKPHKCVRCGKAFRQKYR
ncbi:unnamed protein product [Protopolystoma xenopodis]|uniref:C2H2-type domain-containing protein n=1 Tax=Protopolystoma xenopodis TaxID=117903 RepID=A0A3S4ZLU3_9PLAT|nr:unnamed protein product [Protopolystoma xenopodis]